MSHILANGVELYYELHGPPDGDVLVLSNGVLMSTASWGFQTPVLSQTYRLLLYDCRGMWKSEHPPGPYTMELHANDLACLLDGLGIERAHVGGISYGAEVSMAFAIHYPHRVRSLVLSSCVSQVDPVLRGFVRSWSTAARARDGGLLYQISYPLNFSDRWIRGNQAALDAAAARYDQLDFDALLELFDCFDRLDLTAQLPCITSPTLVMVGEEDTLKPRRYGDIIARTIPGAKMVVVPGAGHALCMEQPEIFNSLVLGFLACQAGGR